MTAREQTDDRKLYRPVLAYNNFTNLLREGVNVIGHYEIISGNTTIRKSFEVASYRRWIEME